MSDEQKNIYEGLFLFPQSVTANLQGAVDHVHELLDRAEAEVVSFGKWDERRLAYEVKGNKRGVYFLAYFRAAPSKMTGLERDCNLSEMMLRALVTRADHVPEELIQSADRRAQLADEIKLREEQSKPTPEPEVQKTAAIEPEGKPKAKTAEASAPVAAAAAGADTEAQPPTKEPVEE